MRSFSYSLIVAVQFLSINWAQVEPRPVPKPVVLAHYLCWYQAPPVSPNWGWHWTMNRFKPDAQLPGQRKLASHYTPAIGPYDSSDDAVIEYHLLSMKLAGIDGVIIDWYGTSNHLDYPLIHRAAEKLIRSIERMQMKFVICYEDRTITTRVNDQKLLANARVSAAKQDLDWVAKRCFTSPAYVKIENMPVLLSFGHEGLTDKEWPDVLTSLPTKVHYVSEHHRRSYGQSAYDWPIPKQYPNSLERFAQELAGQAFIPVVFPRFHDIYEQANLHASYGYIDDAKGKTLEYTLAHAIKQRQAIIQIATWNDWGEGTSIEPTIEMGDRDLRIIQRVLRDSFGEPKHKQEDLALPPRLLKLRRAKVATVELDEAAQHLLSGASARALTIIERLERQ